MTASYVEYCIVLYLKASIYVKYSAVLYLVMSMNYVLYCTI